MKKLLLLVLSIASVAAVFILAKDDVLNSVETFKGALEEVNQWKTLM